MEGEGGSLALPCLLPLPLLLLLLSCPLPCSGEPSPPVGCLRLSHCRCLRTDGSGLVNLAAVADPEGFVFRAQPLPSGARGISASFSPCFPFSEPAGLPGSGCQDVAVCVAGRYPGSPYTDFGRHEGNEFNYSNETKILTVTYHVSYQSVTEDPDVLQIYVQSPCACPNSCQLEDVGPGTIILIILLLALALYFLFGSCSLRPTRTAEGIEMVPEEHVWCHFCYAFS
ncbi:uncharacterized protein LOC115096562 isoform X2 [Rhinatrema bivittatum]|uniref:uncharacterized protein LOC115096562 isoform X2 n=1 Tax=Rhinatrema bivittatum TaxID=194408 RepID=UPI00112D8CC1|nr:uncharacterized protein LOC115096562 isoform X2 [Rhinatrema bivittatum]